VADRRLTQARRLRSEATRAEAALWTRLRGRAFEGLKFRRQAPLGRYIVDFVCLEHRLVIELDGGIHDAPFRDPERDRLRDDWLRPEGYRVLRFRNDAAVTTPNLILDEIRKALSLPSPLGGEGGPEGVG
jgi:very-short-patch-repair endonuclease